MRLCWLRRWEEVPERKGSREDQADDSRRAREAHVSMHFHLLFAAARPFFREGSQWLTIVFVMDHDGSRLFSIINGTVTERGTPPRLSVGAHLSLRVPPTLSPPRICER